MRKLAYYVGASLDGYIAGPTGDPSFLPVDDEMTAWIKQHYPETIPTHLRPHVGMAADEPNQRFDTLVMGRATYEPALEINVTSPYAHLNQHVVSTTLGDVGDPSVTIVDRDPAGLVRRLKQEEGMDIWLCGGGKLAGELLDEIDEVIVKSYPVIAGAGVPAFSGNFHPTAFVPTRREDLANGTQISWYSRG